MNLTLMAERLFLENKLAGYPHWAVVIKEDIDIFESNCKCAIFNEWSGVKKRFFDYFVQLFVNNFLLMFYPSFPYFFCNASAGVLTNNQNMCNLSMAILDFLTPILMVVCFLNLCILSKLFSKDATVFKFQFFQNLSAFLFFFTDNDWSVYILYTLVTWPGLHPLMTWLHEIFLFWFHLMSESIIFDRFLSVNKPIWYKKHAKPRRAYLLILMLFFASFLLTAYRLFLDYVKGIKNYGDLCLGILTAFFIPLQIFLTYKFVSRLSAQSTISKSHSNPHHQNSINKIILGNSVVDFFSVLTYSIEKLTRFYNYSAKIKPTDTSLVLLMAMLKIFSLFFHHLFHWFF